MDLRHDGGSGGPLAPSYDLGCAGGGGGLGPLPAAPALPGAARPDRRVCCCCVGEGLPCQGKKGLVAGPVLAHRVWETFFAQIRAPRGQRAGFGRRRFRYTWRSKVGGARPIDGFRRRLGIRLQESRSVAVWSWGAGRAQQSLGPSGARPCEAAKRGPRNSLATMGPRTCRRADDGTHRPALSPRLGRRARRATCCAR